MSSSHLCKVSASLPHGTPTPGPPVLLAGREHSGQCVQGGTSSCPRDAPSSRWHCCPAPCGAARLCSTAHPWHYKPGMMEAAPQGQTAGPRSGSCQGWTCAVTLSPLGKHALLGTDPQIPSPSNSSHHLHPASLAHVPIRFLIRIFISSEQGNELQEAEKCTA